MKILKNNNELIQITRDPFHQDYINQTLLNPDKLLQRELFQDGLDAYEKLLEDSQVGSVFGSLAASITALQYQIEKFDDSPEAVNQAEFIKECLEKLDMSGITSALLVGLITGFKPAEILLFKNKDGSVKIKDIKPRYARNFVFDAEYNLRYLSMENMLEGVELPQERFVVFTRNSHIGTPYGDPLGKTLYWLVFFKKNAIKFWNIFLSKFGIPSLKASYPPNNLDMKKELEKIVEFFQSSNGIVLPEGTTVELVSAVANSSGQFTDFLDYFDKQISKRILGHSASADSTSGKLGNENLADDIRADYKLNLANQIENLYTNTIVKLLQDLNFANPLYAKFRYVADESVDTKKEIEIDDILVNKLGVPISKQQAYDRYNRVEPIDEKDSIAKQLEPEAELIPTKEKSPKQMFQEFSEKISKGDLREMAIEKGKKQIAYDSFVEPIRKLLSESATLEEFSERLLMFNEPVDKVAKQVEQSKVLAALVGMYANLIEKQ